MTVPEDQKIDGLKIKGIPNLSSDEVLLDALPSGGFWSITNAVPYTKGEHSSLKRFDPRQYILHD